SMPAWPQLGFKVGVKTVQPCFRNARAIGCIFDELSLKQWTRTTGLHCTAVVLTTNNTKNTTVFVRFVFVEKITVHPPRRLPGLRSVLILSGMSAARRRR